MIRIDDPAYQAQQAGDRGDAALAAGERHGPAKRWCSTRNQQALIACRERDALPLLRDASIDAPRGEACPEQPMNEYDRVGRFLHQSAGPPTISEGILRLRYWPLPGAPKYLPSSTITLPRKIVTTGQAKMSCPSHGE